MRYALSLQAYRLPEWDTQPPPEWEQRLREISPVTDTLSHLRFRWFAPHDHWFHPERGVWGIYACTPRQAVPKDKALGFQYHWSEMPLGYQTGRKALVSSYQHYMWHTQGVSVQPFWILQGEWGGTPAQYSSRERRYLDASHALSEPYPIGFFPPCDFNERAVNLILQRDRLVQSCNNVDRLLAMDKPEALKAEDEAAERVFRETYLDTMFVMMQPQAEYLKSQKAKLEMDGLDLPKETADQARARETWKDHFVEHGSVPNAGLPTTRQRNVALV